MIAITREMMMMGMCMRRMDNFLTHVSDTFSE